MAIEVSKLNEAQLSQLIANHRAKGATDAPLYMRAEEELKARGKNGLDVKTTVDALTQAARQRRFLSYGDLAKANGASWNKVHFPIAKHLDEVIDYCHRNGIPFLTAIVVPKPNVRTGRQNADTIRGFTACMERLGVNVTVEEEFIYAEQKRVFEWGRVQPSVQETTDFT